MSDSHADLMVSAARGSLTGGSTATDSRPNLLLQIDSSGAVIAEAGLPQEILDCRAAEPVKQDPQTTRASFGSGFEGVAVLRELGTYKLLVAQQRGWNYTTPACEPLDDDPDDADPVEPTQTRIWIFDPADASWDYVAYELEPLGPEADWIVGDHRRRRWLVHRDRARQSHGRFR